VIARRDADSEGVDSDGELKPEVNNEAGGDSVT
jgi:hypothetical protein